MVRIFKSTKTNKICSDGTRKAFEELQAEINKHNKQQLSIEEIALGFIDVANETMCRPIRTLTEAIFSYNFYNTHIFRQKVTIHLTIFWFASVGQAANTHVVHSFVKFQFNLKFSHCSLTWNAESQDPQTLRHSFCVRSGISKCCGRIARSVPELLEQRFV